jgi:tetratricopeptide (TPR) repeat protein
MIRGLFSSCLLLPLTLLVSGSPFAQQQQLGNISGRVRIAGADLPPRQIIVELRLHGGTVSSVYTDVQGYFSFSGLEANLYHVAVNDEDYYPADERAAVNPEAPNTIVQIILRPREDKKKDFPLPARASGGNPYLMDPADYSKRFPKKAVKEYERGLDAEHQGKRDEAIGHYLGALKIAPDYYPAHNNLGTLYLGKSEFKSAEEQFRETVRLDSNDAQAYFNLSNVLLLTGRYSESETALSAGLQRSPDSAFAHFLQGSLFERAGKFAEAERSLREAIRLDPSMSQAHLQLVNLYLLQNRKEDAIRQLQDFLKAFPSAPTASKAREVLNKLQGEKNRGSR